MRVKNVFAHFHLRARAKLVWSRITLSRLTTTYFVITAIHCIIQIVFQSHAFSINASAADSLWSLLVQANETGEANGFAIFGDDLRICYSLPAIVDRNQCTSIVWSGKHSTTPGVAQADSAPTSSVPSVAQAIMTSAPTANSFATPAEPPIQPTQPAPPVQAAPPAQTAPPIAAPPPVPATSTPTIFTTFVSTPTGVSRPPANPVNNANGGLTSNNINGINAAGQGSGNGFENIVAQLTGLSHAKRGVLVVENLDNSFSVTGFPADGLDPSIPVTLSKTCIQTLIWPVQKLDNTKREDITLIGFQIWVMSMSIAALLNESIPHIFAAVVTQFLVAIWTVEEIFETQTFRDDFVRLTVNGACSGHNLLGSYWSARKNAEIVSAVLNIVDVFLIGFFTYKLVKIYSWQTYKRIGASLTINRVYKLVLCLSVAIQLALFFIVVAAGLWLDQLYHGAAARLSEHRTLYIVFLTLLACLLVPWLTLGWFSIRREMRKACAVFLILNVAFILVWAALYGSNSFRWTFTIWSFFAVMSIAAGILIASTLGLALACRLNFGKGLPQYLNVQEPVDGVDFAPVFPTSPDEKEPDPEKVDFPSFNGPSPTYSTFNQHGGALRVPDKALHPSHQRMESKSSASSSTRLARTDTLTSDTSQSPTDSRKMGNRMVIE